MTSRSFISVNSRGSRANAAPQNQAALFPQSVPMLPDPEYALSPLSMLNRTPADPSPYQAPPAPICGRALPPNLGGPFPSPALNGPRPFSTIRDNANPPGPFDVVARGQLPPICFGAISDNHKA
jgi:hypothetical protein